jgi:radical SAM/Cys-rich protein
VNSFQQAIGGRPLQRGVPEILQLNVGKVCNQTCAHCHVDAGPSRTESMDNATAAQALRLLDHFPSVHTLDITGGAPELNSNFRPLALAGRARGLRVIDRCNLTVLLHPGQEDLVTFLAANRITLVASLPCYLEENVDKQRGRDVYKKSIEALRLLNAAGFGKGTGLELNLVYNPTGLGLPPPQGKLEQDYKDQLRERFGLEFDHLITITNMPISRFEKFLRATGQLDAYQRKLEDAFNPATLAGLMCRNTISVGWDGWLYDCDFNQMLDMRLTNGKPLHVSDFDPETFRSLPILTANHCFGCTAGSGSSCGGALVG